MKKRNLSSTLATFFALTVLALVGSAVGADEAQAFVGSCAPGIATTACGWAAECSGWCIPTTCSVSNCGQMMSSKPCVICDEPE